MLQATNLLVSRTSNSVGVTQYEVGQLEMVLEPRKINDSLAQAIDRVREIDARILAFRRGEQGSERPCRGEIVRGGEGVKAALSQVERTVGCTIDQIDGFSSKIKGSLARTRQLFFSTKYAYWDSSVTANAFDGEQPLDRIAEICGKYGFDFTTGNRSADKAAPDTQHDISHEVASKLGESDAFLQVLPRSEGAAAIADEQIHWLIYERGQARQLDLPMYVIVVCREGESVRKWIDHIKVGSGLSIVRCPEKAGPSGLMTCIEKGIGWLAATSASFYRKDTR